MHSVAPVRLLPSGDPVPITMIIMIIIIMIIIMIILFIIKETIKPHINT